MEDGEQKKNLNFIKTLALLYTQKIEMNQMIENSIINYNNPLLCCLVNRNIIENLEKIYLYDEISSLVDNLRKNNKPYNFDFFKGENATNIINTIKIDDKKLLMIKISLPDLPFFFETEKLKIQGYEFPYNFSIIRKELLELLLQNENIKDINNMQSNCIKNFNVLIGKEGIFIWNKEKQKEYIIIYYLDNFSSEINKIYLYEKEEEFLDELKNNIIGKTKSDYFKFRKINNKEIGFYNSINDGKIIFKYINIIQIDNFKKEESKENNFDNILAQAEEKSKKIECFLEHLLINLYYIKHLREIFNNNLNKNKIENIKKSLLEAFSEFVLENMSKSGNNINIGINNHIKEKIKNFKEIFSDYNLGENIAFDGQYENRVYENLIQKIIDTFKNDMKIKDNIEDMPNIIEELFYGIKNTEINNFNFEYFNTLHINKNQMIEDQKNENPNVINSGPDEMKKALTLEESDIYKLPEQLILVLDDYDINEEGNIIKIIPLELMININNGAFQERYKFLSSIQNNRESTSKFSSIIKKQENFFKIHYNSINNSYQENLISENEIGKSFVFFYERIKELE